MASVSSCSLALWTERFGVKPVLLLDDVSSDWMPSGSMLMGTISSGNQTLLLLFASRCV